MHRRFGTPVVLLVLFLCPLSANACTLWGVAREGADGGTLMAKNRDWVPDHSQRLKVVHPKKGWAYLGLYAEGNNSPGLKAGINERGLSIVSASSNIPRKIRESQVGMRGVMITILSSYDSVDAVIANAHGIFSRSHANFFLISDRHKILRVEVGLDGTFAFTATENGMTAHTNHYLDSQLAARYNTKIGPSSATRLNRITTLLEQTPSPYTLETFSTLSRDRYDGPENSLWRNGREHTVASWIVASPRNAPARLRVVIANPGEAESTQEFRLDADFWRNPTF